MQKTFYGKYGFIIIFVTVFLLAFIWMGTKRTLLSNSNNVTDWLPDNFKETKDYQWFLKQFPFESFIIASWDGCTLDDSRLEMLAQKLVPEQTIDNLSGLSLRTEQPMIADLVVPEEQVVPELVVTIPQPKDDPPPKPDIYVDPDPNDDVGLKYFKSVLTGPRLVRMMEDRYSADEKSPIYLSRDQILQRLDGTLIGPGVIDGKVINPEDRKTALIVTLTSGIKGNELRKVVAKIKEFARECGIEPPLPPDDQSLAEKAIAGVKLFVYELFNDRVVSTSGIILGGPPIDNVAIDFEGSRTLTRLAGLCGAIGLIIAYLCLRSLTMTFIVFGVGVLSAGISLAMVWFTGSHCDAILLSMPALVYVLTMAASIHIINYYFDAIRETGLEGAPEKAIKAAWYPCTVASLTGVFGLDSLYMSNLVPIVKFGNYSAIGVLCAIALLFLLLPSLLHYFPARKYAKKYAFKGIEAQADSYLFRFWSTLGKFIVKYHKMVIIICLAWMIISVWGLWQIKTSVKMMRFFSRDSEIVQHYTWLEKQLGPLVPMEVVIKFKNDECQLKTYERMQYVDDVCQKLREKLPDEVGGVMSAATIAPSLSLKNISGSLRRTAEFYLINGQLDRGRGEMQDYLTYEKVSFDISRFKDREAEFSEIMNRMGFSLGDAQRLCTAGIMDHWTLVFRTEGRKYFGLTDEELTTFRERAKTWQEKEGIDLWRISMRVWSLKKDDIDYALFVNNIKEVVEDSIGKKSEDKKIIGPDAISAVYTGMVPVVYKTQHELLNGLRNSLYLAFTSIMLMLMFVLRSPLAGFLTMIPNILPIFVVFGFLGFCGILVDVGTMMTASVALGIAVDDTVHYLTWFRAEMDEGATVPEAALRAYEKCAEAMTETTWVCGFGLFAFAFSTFAPTQMFGIMMLTLLTTALIGALIFLPAIVASPLGKYFYNGKKNKEKKK